MDFVRGKVTEEISVNRVIEKGLTEISKSIDMQDIEEGGHDQNEGVPEEGDPPPPPPPESSSSSSSSRRRTFSLMFLTSKKKKHG